MITIIVATVIMGDAMIYNVLPSNVSAFGVAVGLVGVLLSANRFVRLASNPLAAYLLERFGTSRPVLASMVVAVGTTVLLGVAKGFVLLLLARVLWGVSFSILRLTGYLVVLEEGEDGGRGRLMGVFSGGIRIGSLVGVLLGGILFDILGRGPSFLIIAAIGLLSIPAFLKLVPSSRPGDVVEAETEGKRPSEGGGFGRRECWTKVVESGRAFSAWNGHRTTIQAASRELHHLRLLSGDGRGTDFHAGLLPEGAAGRRGRHCGPCHWNSDPERAAAGGSFDVRRGGASLGIPGRSVRPRTDSHSGNTHVRSSIASDGVQRSPLVGICVAAGGVFGSGGSNHLLECRSGWNGARPPEVPGDEPPGIVAGLGLRLRASSGVRRSSAQSH